MLKEKGYDEFVEKCIKEGREEYQAGLGYSLEQAKARSKQILEKKSQELEDFSRNIIYG